MSWMYPSVYEIKKGYKHRKSVVFFDDTPNKDEWQKEVYEYTLSYIRENNFNTILDIGCGSGFKTVKYFGSLDITGVEIEPTLTFLKSKYPGYKWRNMNEIEGEKYDVIICADVIEHIKNPDTFLENIIKSIGFKKFFISTPDRSIVSPQWDYGPPLNPSHFREWNFEEFNRLISKYLLVDKHFISNKEQGTQLISAFPKPKEG